MDFYQNLREEYREHLTTYKSCDTIFDELTVLFHQNTKIYLEFHHLVLHAFLNNPTNVRQLVVAFLFSSNALRVSVLRPAMPEARALKLAEVQCGRLALAVAPLMPGMVEAANPVLDGAWPAPYALAKFGEVREVLRQVLGKVPSDQVILVGDLGLERDWCAAGRLAGYLSAERYFW